jgi:hypothetical protein
MATLGPTATKVDVSTFANFATFADNTQGINKALTNFGWTRTADLNQINWGATPTAVPFTGTGYPITNQPTVNYKINARGNWVTGTNYAIGDVVFDTTTQSSYYTFLAITNSTTVPSTDTTHFLVYHYEIWNTADTVVFNITNVSRTAGGLATFTCTNRLKAGFVVVIAGLTNVPSLNGTWTVASTGVAGSPPVNVFTVQTGGGTVGSTADTGTATYSMQTICMKLEYWGNTAAYTAEPWVRLSFGTSTDGLGNLSGNFIGGNNSFQQTTGNFLYCDLRPNTAAGGNQATARWQCIWSGSSSRFGTALWYNDSSAAFAAYAGSIFWVVERAHDDAGNEIDDYFTYLCGCTGSANGIFGQTNQVLEQRSILKYNPTASVSNVTIDGSNNLSIVYTTLNISGYRFAAGAVVLLSGFNQANFLNGQFIQVVPIALTSVANAAGGSTVYTGTVPNGGSNFYVGTNVTVAGFTTAANRGTFACTASTTTTLTLSNASGVSETNPATAQASGILNGVFTHAAYGPTAPDVGVGLMRLSTSSSTFVPISGTGGVCYADPRVATPLTSLSTLLVNGNTTMLPIYPIPGFVGNPMTVAQVVRSADENAHDTTSTTVTLYGATRTYYFPQGATGSNPYNLFGSSDYGTTNGGFVLRWD